MNVRSHIFVCYSEIVKTTIYIYICAFTCNIHIYILTERDREAKRGREGKRETVIEMMRERENERGRERE